MMPSGGHRAADLPPSGVARLRSGLAALRRDLETAHGPGDAPSRGLACGAGPISARVGAARFFSDEKKLSIAALSQTLPDRLIEHVMPWSDVRRWNCSLVYCDP